MELLQTQHLTVAVHSSSHGTMQICPGKDKGLPIRKPYCGRIHIYNYQRGKTKTHTPQGTSGMHLSTGPRFRCLLCIWLPKDAQYFELELVMGSVQNKTDPRSAITHRLSWVWWSKDCGECGNRAGNEEALRHLLSDLYGPEIEETTLLLKMCTVRPGLEILALKMYHTEIFITST